MPIGTWVKILKAAWVLLRLAIAAYRQWHKEEEFPRGQKVGPVTGGRITEGKKRSYDHAVGVSVSQATGVVLTPDQTAAIRAHVDSDLNPKAKIKRRFEGGGKP